MWSLEEEYFFKLKKIAHSRLNPSSVLVYLVGLWLYSLVMLGISTWIIKLAINNGIAVPFVFIIYSCFLVIFLCVFVYLLMCLFWEKILYKTQKVATFLMVLYTIVMSVEPLFLCRLFALDESWGKQLDYWIIISVTIALIQFLVCFQLVKKGILKGSLKKDGTGLFGENKPLKLLIQIMIGSYLLLVFWLFFIIGLSTNIIGPIIFLALMFLFSIAIQEFIILAICRYRFSSFNVSYEEATKYRVNKKRR
ncbi:hypothetical protein [Listeria booriae]|uniref:hypothetical protein n=1 Tax=Listeria booriae TaxID=1552123 RepID=UPI001629D3BC|nr:hypothetical protein [Listeria booriae]MBC2258784.1 hypothetical protein [Listeria booriae]